MVRKIFRYKLVTVYFILSQLIVFTAIFGVLQIYNKAYAKENDRLKAVAANRIELDMVSSGEKDILSEVGKDISAGNIIAEGRLATEFTEAGCMTRCEVLLAVNEELPYPVIEGHIPGTDENDYGRNVVALGRDKYRYAYDRNGKKYVTIDQEEYEVVGLIGSEQSDYWDYRVVFNINCTGNNTKRIFNSQQSQVLTLYSNHYDMEDSYEILYNNLVASDSMCNITPYKKNSTGKTTINDTLAKENVRVNIMVYIFCLLNCIIISMLWIIQRRKELAVKRTFGYGNGRILAGIAGNISLMMVLSFAVFIVLYYVYRMMAEEGTGLVIEWNTTSVVSVIVLFFVTLLITMIYPVCNICYRNSADLVG